MRIEFAHIRERAAAGGWIDFAVFDARPANASDEGNAQLLIQLTTAARQLGLKIDQAALAYFDGAQFRFYGSKPLVEYLSRNGLPSWTHYLDV